MKSNKNVISYALMVHIQLNSCVNVLNVDQNVQDALMKIVASLVLMVIFCISHFLNVQIFVLKDISLINTEKNVKSVFFHVFNAYLTDNVNRVSMDFWIPKLIFVSQTALKGIMLHYNQISAKGVNIPAKHANSHPNFV